jgi:hypothetical protein
MLLQAAERWAFDEDCSYATIQFLARLHTDAGFDLLQKQARHINRVVRLRAYNMLSFVWPQDGRTLDSATEQKALDDLAAQTYDNTDRRIVILALLTCAPSLRLSTHWRFLKKIPDLRHSRRW